MRKHKTSIPPVVEIRDCTLTNVDSPSIAALAAAIKANAEAIKALADRCVIPGSAMINVGVK